MTFFRQLPAPETQALCYLIADLDKRQAVVIDPTDEHVFPLLFLLDELRSSLVRILVTHAHGPHVPGAEKLSTLTEAPVSASARAPLQLNHLPLADGETVAFGNEIISARQTPGHTPGCITYLWRDRAFTGDTLLIDHCGSTAEPDSDAGLLYDSVTQRLLALPDETLIYPAHSDDGRLVTTIGEQRQRNAGVVGRSRDEFIAAQRSLTSTPSSFGSYAS